MIENEKRGVTQKTKSNAEGQAVLAEETGVKSDSLYGYGISVIKTILI